MYQQIKEKVKGKITFQGRKYGKWVVEREYYYDNHPIEFADDCCTLLHATKLVSHPHIIYAIMSKSFHGDDRQAILSTIEWYYFASTGEFLC